MHYNLQKGIDMKKVYLLLTVLLTYSATLCASDLKIRHVRPESAADIRSHYYIDMLRLALHKTSAVNGTATLVMTNKTMYQNRAIEQLKLNKDIDVLWTMTSTETGN